MMDEFTELQNGVNKLDKLQILLITLEAPYVVNRNGTDSLKKLYRLLLITLKKI